MKPKSPDSEVRRNLSKRWYNLIGRCTNPLHERYMQYGGAGVSVCEEWLDKEKFILDVKEISGYSEQALLAGKLHLDKDSLVSNNKIYSSHTCVFIDPVTNNKFKPNQMVTFEALSPRDTLYESSNQSEFARTHGLNQSDISACLNGKRDHVGGWLFRYKE